MDIEVRKEEDGSLVVYKNGIKVKLSCTILAHHGNFVTTSSGTGNLRTGNDCKVYLLHIDGNFIQLEE